MTGDKGACWRCFHFDRDDDDEEESGFCRRYPPAVVMVDEDEVMIVWPSVEYLDHCGEFKEDA